ncbi:metallophosphoesterase [Shouchella hunanensis]|uniref:Metallophosphoesterase n=1 Tax=Shouchella hunanensis TaxID=766894 RepID=A0ABY7W6B4_9BACI|nr:metallophosphoesterase [Shouchella hunanensis]WDF04487.1 metallophosphoesterase [Shouchella hunanensis]GAF23755.1 Ser/Thr protein phosphatase family protein [Bacillus sp. JCM 19047]
MFSRKTILVLLLLFIVAIYFFYTQNHRIVLSSHSIEVAQMDAEHNGITIVHLSDLHSAEFGEKNERLIQIVQQEDPSFIFMTGDLIDSYTSNNGEGVDLMKELVSIAPTYYVTGNHEWRLGIVEGLEETLDEIGVTVLRNESLTIEHEGFSFQLVGIDDPDSRGTASPEEIVRDLLDEAIPATAADSYTILLSHRPEVFSIYQDSSADLVFSGHAHGGQVRLPFIGGLLAPGQGLFPDYSEGLYEEEDTKMIVSRGLGNSLFPLRLFNRPEVIRIDLQPPS